VSAELLLTSRIVEADEARRIGLLNDLLPADGFPDQLRRWCEQITRNPPQAVFAAKQAVLEGFAVTRDEALTIATAVRSAAPAAFASTR
jgi:enoyl-CoA hydratase/carnithine racemase